MPMIVLVIEDDPSHALLTRMVLEGDNRICGVHLACDGERGIDLLEGDADYDLILVDLRLPRMDGIEVVSWVRQHTRHQTTPIAVLTTSAREDEKIKSLSAGADAFLTKPLSPKHLTTLLSAGHA